LGSSFTASIFTGKFIMEKLSLPQIHHYLMERSGFARRTQTVYQPAPVQGGHFKKLLEPARHKPK
jgi:hypothetical protein